MRRLLTHTLMIGTMLGAWAFAEQTSPEQRSRALELKELATPFKGITTNGQIEPGLFSLKSTGVSTDPVRKAAEAFLASLTAEQRQKAKQPNSGAVLNGPIRRKRRSAGSALKPHANRDRISCRRKRPTDQRCPTTIPRNAALRMLYPIRISSNARIE